MDVIILCAVFIFLGSFYMKGPESRRPDKQKPIDKPKAHIVFAILDVIALLVLWLGVDEIKGVINQMYAGAEVIRFNNMTSYCAMGILLPITHIVFFVLSRKQSLATTDVRGAMRFRSKIEISSLVVIGCMVVGCMFFTSTIKASLERWGYFHCRKASNYSIVCRTFVYTRDAQICEHEIEDRKALNAVISRQ